MLPKRQIYDYVKFMVLFISFITFFTVDINSDVTAGFFAISTCISRRPGSLRVDAFRGHGLSLLEKTTLWGLRTRAIPAGVTTLHLPGLMKWGDAYFCTRTTLANAIPAEEIHGDSWGSKGIGETPECVSTRRLISRPRKA